MNILCTICAREGSKGVKNKALRLINGRPLIYYTLDVAVRSKVFDLIAVSTDSNKIKKAVNKIGNFCWFLRSKKLSGDDISKKLVIKDLLNQSEKKFKKKFDIVVDLDPSAPLRNILDIKQSLANFIKNKNDLMVSVNKSHRNPYFNMLEIKNNKIDFVKKNKKNIFSRQKAPVVYDMNASIHIRNRDVLLNSNSLKTLFTKKSAIFLMPKKRSLDIETEFDLNLFRKLVK